MSATRAMGAKRLDEDAPVWEWATLGAIALASIARLVGIALEVAPLHFDEAQYWTYGKALDWGYYSKPPMIAWVIRLGTDLFGDTVAGVRALSPAIHGWVAWLVFATARRLFDARTGFWSALVYLTLPGVTVGAALMTTDTPMMAAWALGLYALSRAMAAEAAFAAAAEGKGRAPRTGGRTLWWFVFGAAVGLGLLSKYTVLALPLGALGYALTAREGAAAGRPRPLGGPMLALLTALAVFSPNLWWNAQNGFASILHVVDNAKLGDGPAYDPVKALEFFGAQWAVFGPIAFGLLAAMLLLDSGRAGWRRDWAYRLLMWTVLPLVLAMTVQAFLSRSHPNWAAPAYVGASIAVSAWALDRGARAWLAATATFGAVVLVGFFGYGLYLRDHHAELPRAADVFKKIRPGPAICARAMRLREGRPLFGVDRRLMADCLFEAKLGIGDVRMYLGGDPGNHYELVAPIREREPGELLLVHAGPRAQIEGVLAQFRSVTVLEEAAIALHADRSVDYLVAVVSGYRDR